MIHMEEHLAASPTDSHLFAVACVEAIFTARTAASARGAQLMKRDVVQIIEDLDKGRDRPAMGLEPRLKRLHNPKDKIPMSRLNPLKTALAEAWGITGKIGRRAGASIGVAISDIVDAYPNVTPEELKYRATAIFKKYSLASPNTVATYFHTIGGGPMTRVARASIYVELPGWKDKLRQLAKAASYDPATVNELLNTEWKDLSVTVREMLIK